MRRGGPWGAKIEAGGDPGGSRSMVTPPRFAGEGRGRYAASAVRGEKNLPRGPGRSGGAGEREKKLACGAGLAARRARAADAKLGRAGGRAGAAGLRRGRERGEWARGEPVGPGERRERGSGPRVRLG